MSDRILHKRSFTTGSIPTTSSLLVGEIALNVPDGKVYIHKSGSEGQSIESAITSNSTSSIGVLTLSGSLILSGSPDINSGSVFDVAADNISFDFDSLSFSGSAEITGSLLVTDGITGSLQGTASFAQTASYVTPLNQTVEITGSLRVSGSIDTTDIVHAILLSGSLRTDKISFTEQGTFTGVQGDLGYSFADGKFTFYIENDVPIELGQTLYARVRNADTVVLTKGTIVDFTADTTGQTPRVKRAIATSGADCSCFIGVVLQDIGLNGFGAIMLNGVARGLNLTAFNTDDQLYLSTTVSGSATTTIPTPPVKAIRIGKVLNASASPTQGVLYVRPENRTVYFDLDQFKQSYNTGSFTGSFTGDGSQLTGIVSSKWSGSNPITRDSDVEITGSLSTTGNISSLTLAGSDNRIVLADPQGTLDASNQTLIEAYINPTSSAALLLNDTNNWDIYGIYAGAPITGTVQGQRHYNIDYFFEAVDDNDWIRLIRG